MNPEIKTQWVAALRSGEYKQGRSYLRSEDNTYCCLGVLTDLAGREGVGEWDTSNRFIPNGDVFDAGFALPSQAVADWAGLGYTDPIVTSRVGQGSLSALNDNGVPFADIADLIEAQL